MITLNDTPVLPHTELKTRSDTECFLFSLGTEKKWNKLGVIRKVSELSPYPQIEKQTRNDTKVFLVWSQKTEEEIESATAGILIQPRPIKETRNGLRHLPKTSYFLPIYYASDDYNWD